MSGYTQRTTSSPRTFSSVREYPTFPRKVLHLWRAAWTAPVETLAESFPHVCSITSVSSRLGEFHTVVMFGNNFGLFGNVRRARWLLKRLHGMTSQTARILAESRDPYQTTSVDHRGYQQLNRRRGRLPGQLRIRVRFGHARTPWFDYLIASPREMRDIVAGTGWAVARVIRTTGPDYVAVLEKTAA